MRNDVQLVVSVENMEISLSAIDVLIFEDNEVDAALLKDAITKLGYRVEIATNLAQAKQHIENPDFGIAFVNLHLDDGSGLDLIASLKTQTPHFACVAMTEQADVDIAVQAMRAGAADFVTKPIQTKVLAQVLERCKETHRPDVDRERHQIALRGSTADTTAREIMELKSQEQKVSLTAIQNAMSVSAAILDHEGNISFVNDAWRAFARENGGDDEYSWIGQNYFEHAENGIDNDAERDLAVAGMRAVLAGEQEHFKHTYHCQFPDSEFWFRMEVCRVADSQPLTAVVMHFDVTDMMKARRDAEEKERRLRSMVDTIIWGILTIDEKGVIEEVNPAVQEIFGYTDDELIGKNVSMLMPEPDHSRHDSYLANFIETGDAKIIGIGREVVGQRKDGSLVPLNLGVSEVEVDGRRRFTGMVFDISERKLAEEALRERETRMREILDASPLGISIISWDTDKRIYVNPRLVEMMGADSAEHLLSTSVDESFVDPASRPRRANKIDYEGYGKEMEVRRRRRDGTEWWCLMHNNVIDVDGERMIISWHHDIDERKQTEQYLMENEARLRNVLDGSPVGVSITSRKLKKRVYVNQRAVEMFGAESSEQLLADDIAASFASPEDYKEVNPILSSEGLPPDSECLRLRKDGTEWWCLASSRLIQYGGEEALFTWMYDISERRVMQHALKKSENRFRDFASTTSDWYWEMDEELRYTFLSERYEEVTGYDRSQRLGKTMMEVGALTLPEKELLRRFDTYRNRQPFRNHLHQRQQPDGSTVYLSVSGVPTFDSEGRFKGYRGTGTDITDEVLAENRIRESEQRFQLLAAASTAGVFYVDPEGLCLFVNEAFSTITGVPAEGFRNTPWYRTIYHKDIGRFVEEWRPTASGDAAFRAEYRFAHPDGHLVWAEINATQHCATDGSLLGYLGTAINIEERKSIERELHEVEARATAVLDNAPAAIYIKDTDGRYLQMNNRFKEMFEVDDDALGKTDKELFSRKIAEVLTKNDSIVLTSGTSTEEEETINLMNGPRIFLTSRIPLYNIGGEPYAVCAISTDITERKMTEVQLLHSSKMASIGSMSAGIAHELSQPLHIMNLIADNKLIELENGEANLADVHTSLETVSEQCRRMAQTILHMSVFSRIDDVDHELFEVRPALSETIALLKQPFMAEGITLKAKLPKYCGHALGHPSQFEQVIINLLTNARDAMKDSAAETTNDIPEITLSCKPNLAYQTLEITVDDQGPGIPERVMPRIFDPFYTTKEPDKGTGLGLAISMGIINSMGGIMKAANTPSGTRFTISLPLRSDESISSAEPSAPPVEPTESSPVTEGRRILIVDDEHTAASTLALHLRRLGYEVDTANDGSEAFSKFIEEPADLVVTDLRMPKMDGEELIGKLRSENTDLPIVIVTGDLDAGDLMKNLPGRGPVHLLRKPLILRNLYDQLEQLLKPAGGSTAQRSK